MRGVLCNSRAQTGVLENGGRVIILYGTGCGGYYIIWNRVRGVLYLMRERVTWGWRKLHNEELHDFYCTPDKVWGSKLIL